MITALYLLLLVPLPHLEPVEFPLPEPMPEQIERAAGFRIYLV